MMDMGEQWFHLGIVKMLVGLRVIDLGIIGLRVINLEIIGLRFIGLGEIILRLGDMEKLFDLLETH
jgi:hypothetical protein